MSEAVSTIGAGCKYLAFPALFLAFSLACMAADPKYPPLDYDPEKASASTNLSSPQPGVAYPDRQQGSGGAGQSPPPLPAVNPYLTPMPYGAALPPLNERATTEATDSDGEKNSPAPRKDKGNMRSPSLTDAQHWPPLDSNGPTNERTEEQESAPSYLNDDAR